MKRYHYITPQDYEQAEENGISKERVYYRVHRSGWDVDRAITEPVRNHKKIAHLIPIAEKNGIGYDTLKARLRYGWDGERAATEPLATRQDRLEALKKAREQRPKIIPREYIDKAEKNGISYQTLYFRVRRSGMGLEEAATTPIMKIGGIRKW